MFKIVHIIESVCRIVVSVCRTICNVFMCPEHAKKGDINE